MSKFSVKKPLTVFVAVVVVIVLGIVSYTNMTPTLFPNMDLPYVIVMTTYPGASPEKVETEVTKPMEESMSTLENINTVSSTSNENYSLLILEFSEDANLDAITVDILQKVDQIEPYWDSLVGSPYILKINPDMLPVTMAAIDMEGMDTAELSTFINDELLNKLEGINGVASVSANGLLEEEINIELSQEKIDALNVKIRAAIDGQFAESEENLESTKNEMESGLNEIESGKSQLESGQSQLAGQTAEIESQLNNTQSEILEGKIQMQSQLTSMQTQLAELETTEATLRQLQSAVTQLEQAKTAFDMLASYVDFDSMDESTDLAMIKTMIEQMAGPEAAAALDGMNTVGDFRKTRQTVEDSLMEIDQQLASQGLSRSDIGPTITEIVSGKAQLKAGIATIESMLDQVEAGSLQVSEGLKELNKQRTQSTLELSSMATQMILGEATITSALTQIEEGLEQIADMKTAAYESSDLNNIITMSMVSTILTAQNFSMPAGQLEENGVTYMISVGDEFDSIQEMEDLLLFDLGMDGLDPIYLTDVAEIIKTDNSDEIYTKVNGNNGVIVSFTKQSNGATADVSDNINARFAELEEEYEGLSFTNLMDQGDYIYMVVDTIMQNLILGAIFAVIILFLFLKDLRPTFVTLCSIPISVLFAVTLMYFAGVSINLLSLSGLAVAVGMLVDNSVVVIENVYRLRNNGASPVKAAVSGAAQVAGAVMASTLTTICVFLPIVFVDGLTRQLFVDFALTFGFALVASLIVSLTLVPAMSAGLLVKQPKQHKEHIMGPMMKGYEVSVRWALKHKVIVLLAAAGLLVLSAVLALAKGFTFMPDMGSESVSVSLEMPEDAEFEDATVMADEVIDVIHNIEGVGTVGAMMSSGTSLMSSFGGASSGTSVTMYVLLDEESDRSTKDIADEINEACADLDCEVTASNASTMDISALMGSGVSMYLYGDDLELLQNTAREVGEVLAGVEGIGEVSDGMEDADPGYKIVVDKEKAMKEGLTVAQVYSQISAALTTETSSTTVADDGNNFDVVVSQGEDAAMTLYDLQNFKFTVESTSMTGTETKEISIRDIAELIETETMNSISRTNQKRYMSVSGEIEDGYNVSLVTSDVQKALDSYTLPAGITLEYSGENETIMEAMVELMKMLGLGVLLVYLVMVAQFQSLKSPFIIMFTIPLAFTGGLIALLIAGYEVSVISLIGFVMLVGIIVNNGIVLVDYMNQLRQDGVDKYDAIIEAGVTRMRPVLMTSLTTILGLSVTALSSGMGSDMMKPISIVCIGGLIYATILTMYVVPCLYDMLNRKKFRVIDEDDLIISDDIG